MNNTVVKIPEYEELMRLRKRKKTREKIRIAIVFTLIAVSIIIFALAYRERETIAPKLKGTVPFPAMGAETEASFPMAIPPNTDFQTAAFGETFVILTNGKIFLYDKKGKTQRWFPLDYSNPRLKTSNERMLIYEGGGNSFQVCNKRKIIYEIELENRILFGIISGRGYTAIAYKTDKSASAVNVYNDRGRLIYQIKSSDMLTGAVFTDNSEGLAAIFPEINAIGSQTRAVFYNFKDDKSTKKSEEVGGFPYYAEYFGKLFTIGAENCAFYEKNGEIASKYPYFDEFLGYSYHEGKAVVLLHNKQTHRYFLDILSQNTKVTVEFPAAEELKYVEAKENKFFLLTNNAIYVYNYSGEKISATKVGAGFDTFKVCGNSIYLINEEKIELFDVI